MTRFLPLAGLLLLAACGGAKTDAPAGTTEAKDAAPAAKAEVGDEKAGAAKPVAEVRVAPATIGSTGDVVTAYGTTEAGPGAGRAIVAPAEAIVGAVLAPTGTAVRAGQPVVTLRPSRASALEAAKSATESRTADAALARAQRLRQDGLVSDAEVETARAAAATARATSATLGIGPGGVTLRAPAAGTVEALTAKAGDQIAAGAAMAAIAGRGDLRARFGVDPVLAARIHAGQTVRLSAAASGTSVMAPVTGVDPAVDATTRLASVFVRVPAGAGLTAGEPVRAQIEVGATSTGLTVPYAALLDDGGRSYVFVVHGGIAKSVDVSPGNSAGDRIAILKGLAPGDQVVVEGGTALEDGMQVRLAGASR